MVTFQNGVSHISFQARDFKMAVPKAKGSYRPRCFFDVEINGSPGKIDVSIWLGNRLGLFCDEMFV